MQVIRQNNSLQGFRAGVGKVRQVGQIRPAIRPASSVDPARLGPSVLTL